MNPPTVSSLPAVPPEVLAFATEQGATEYLYPVLKMTQNVFGRSVTKVLVEEDPEIENNRHILFEVDTTALAEDELFEAQTRWSREIFRHCPATHVCVFRYGLW
jgi:hypothetical protein